MSSKAKSQNIAKLPPRPLAQRNQNQNQPTKSKSSRRKRRPQRSKQARSSNKLVGLPRSLGPMSLQYLDPQGKVDPPRSSTSLGNFTTVNGCMRTNGLTTNTLYDTYFLLQWTPSNYAGFLWNGGAGVDSPIAPFTIPQFNTTALQMKPLRMSICIRNVTQLLSVAGMVRVLHMPQNYDWSSAFGAGNTLKIANVAEIKDLIDSSSLTVTHTMREAMDGRTWVAYPISTVGYNAWYEQQNTASIQDLLVQSSTNETFSTIILHFPPTPTGTQNIDIVVRRQDGFRYPANTALSQTARPAPTAPPGDLERMTRLASEYATVPVENLVPVGTTAARSRALEILDRGQRAATIIGGAYQVGRTLANVAALL